MRRGRHSTSSSSAFDQPSSSHLNDDDDDDGNGEGTSRASIPSPDGLISQHTVNTYLPCVCLSIISSESFISSLGDVGGGSGAGFSGWDSVRRLMVEGGSLCGVWREDVVGAVRGGVKIKCDEDVTTTPSPTITSSSPTPQNAPSKATSTNQTSSSQENTSSSFQSKLQILPPSSNEPTSPHHLNPLLDNILDVPPRPLNPQPLKYGNDEGEACHVVVRERYVGWRQRCFVRFGIVKCDHESSRAYGIVERWSATPK
ncbi:hypothetical protein Tco_0493336 [Tanacetum coccineum]